MSNTTETAARLAEAERQHALAEQAHASAVQAHARATTATVRTLRDAADDALGALNEARLELESARSAHTAAEKARDISQLTAERDGANEVPRLVQKELAALVRAFEPCVRHVANIDTLCASYADRRAVAESLASKLGETIEIKPFSVAAALALALEAMSSGAGKDYYRPNLLRWFAAVPDATERAHTILRLMTGQGAPPPPLNVHEAAAVALRTLDGQAPAFEAAERQRALVAPVVARDEELRAYLQRLDRDEQAEFQRLPSGTFPTFEERYAEVVRRREERKQKLIDDDIARQGAAA
jgi:hypothetical protein